MKPLTTLILSAAPLALGACTAPEAPTSEPMAAASTAPAAKAVPAAAAPKVESGTAEATRFDKPGFAVYEEDGRLWIFRDGSEELALYLEAGEIAKHVVRPGAGPEQKTLKAPDTETIQAYVSQAEGFETFVVDGRLWVFRARAPEIEEFRRTGEPAKHVTRIGAGPLRMTVKAPDGETIDAYLAALAR